MKYVFKPSAAKGGTVVKINGRKIINSKIISNASEDKKMFSMEKIGANIMKYRKAVKMTQMQLADKMGISFQAVSNWERGLSCPDISKLVELAKLFGITTDELLGNERAAEIAQQFAKNKTPEMNNEELVDVIPLLSMEQAQSAVENIDPESEIFVTTLEEAAPHIEQEYLEKIVIKISKKGKLSRLADLAPFLDTKTIDELVINAVDTGEDDIEDFLAYMSSKAVREVADIFLERNDDVEDILPFIDKEEIETMAFKAVENDADIEEYLPFLSKPAVSKIASLLLEKEKDVEDLLPFLNREDVDALALKAVANGADIEDFAPFMSKDGINKLIRRLLSEEE